MPHLAHSGRVYTLKNALGDFNKLPSRLHWPQLSRFFFFSERVTPLRLMTSSSGVQQGSRALELVSVERESSVRAEHRAGGIHLCVSPEPLHEDSRKRLETEPAGTAQRRGREEPPELQPCPVARQVSPTFSFLKTSDEGRSTRKLSRT